MIFPYLISMNLSNMLMPANFTQSLWTLCELSTDTLGFFPTCWKCGSVQFSSVTQSCPTLCDPMDCSMPGLSVHHQLLEFMPSLMSIELVMPSNHLILCRALLVPPSIFLSSGSFLMSQLFPSGGQNTGVSALASVLPKNTQDWSPSEWTGWISLQSKGLSRVFSNTTVQKHQFFSGQPRL